MSLTYNIRFKKKIVEKKQFKEFQEKHKNKILLISDIHTTDRSYVDSIFEDYTIEFDLGTASFIDFDILKKETDPQERNKLILSLHDKIVNEIYPEEDYFFSFNGDIIYQMRENGITKRNSKSSFYQNLD
ncbi:hypothetical protein U8527_00675 [Kordia algicida OT-1]|uniref:Uncharacterized protein n=1 Tax=Kordia algicida OT-1 TaxID=391587 RepID=A9DRK3_9FLAO|nr:hypothetical protein [Kordia algicida]EDP96806.1 hypothetical protein KAOT1_16623 [Kordia algicida OT-1]